MTPKPCSISALILFASFTIAHAAVAPASDPKTVIEYAKAAESDPLGSDARSQLTEAMRFIDNDHTNHVLLCNQLYQELSHYKTPDAGIIKVQYMASTGAFLYEHPEAASDSIAQNVAGLRAALHVYEKLLAVDPGVRSRFLDKMEKEENSGTLSEALAKLCK